MSVATTFLAQLPVELREEASSLGDLEGRLRELRGRGAAAWPALELGEGVFVGGLVEGLVASPPREGLAQWLDHVQAEDLHLALACRVGSSGAIEAFEGRYRTDLERLVRKYEGPSWSGEDLLQHLRERLFVTAGERRARIEGYAGQGLLQNWLRVTGARLFIDLARSAAHRQDRATVAGADGMLEVPDTLQDVELDFLKREYRAKFKEAFEAAARSLSPEERNLLRQHWVHRLTVEQIGRLHGVHGATISRRVGKAREALLAATRAAFIGRLRLEESEYDSIMVMIRSRLELSMPRLLETSIVGEEG